MKEKEDKKTKQMTDLSPNYINNYIKCKQSK